jgi:mevalonate kinase
MKEPDVINSILTSISRISSHAQLTLTSSTLSRASLIAELEILMEENHGHLVSLGVGHEVLERIREKTKKSGLITKLTGAGGGGCAVTIIPDGIFLPLFQISIYATDPHCK